MVHRSELMVIVLIEIGSEKVYIANSYIKPKDARRRQVNANKVIPKHWEKLKEFIKDGAKWLWSGDFNTPR